MWKCSNCDQSSTRRWNLETHIKRKHGGEGSPIKLDHKDSQPSPMQFPASNTFNNESKSHRTSYTLGTRFRRPTGSGSLINPFDFIDEPYEWVRKFSVVKDFINQNSRGNQLMLSWSLPARGESNRIYTELYYPSISFPKRETPIINNIVAFRGYVCKNCLTKYINPVFWFDETRKLVEADHLCQDKFSLNRNLLEFITNLYSKLLLELKDAVNFWTVNNPILVSEPVGIVKNNSFLSISDSTSHSWLSRTINGGETTLNDSELIEFLLTSGYQTYNCFGIDQESPESDHQYYLLRVSKSTGS